jgi:hypothetical protein
MSANYLFYKIFETLLHLHRQLLSNSSVVKLKKYLLSLKASVVLSLLQHHCQSHTVRCVSVSYAFFNR